MDKFDRAILDILQTDCTRSVADIAERIGLGSTACWRRIQKLEEAGIIDRRVALLNPQRLNVSVSVFAAIRTNQHNAAWLEQFHAAVANCLKWSSAIAWRATPTTCCASWWPTLQGTTRCTSN